MEDFTRFYMHFKGKNAFPCHPCHLVVTASIWLSNSLARRQRLQG